MEEYAQYPPHKQPHELRHEKKVYYPCVIVDYHASKIYLFVIHVAKNIGISVPQRVICACINAPATSMIILFYEISIT